MVGQGLLRFRLNCAANGQRRRANAQAPLSRAWTTTRGREVDMATGPPTALATPSASATLEATKLTASATGAEGENLIGEPAATPPERGADRTSKGATGEGDVPMDACADATASDVTMGTAVDATSAVQAGLSTRVFATSNRQASASAEATGGGDASLDTPGVDHASMDTEVPATARSPSPRSRSATRAAAAAPAMASMAVDDTAAEEI